MLISAMLISAKETSAENRNCKKPAEIPQAKTKDSGAEITERVKVFELVHLRHIVSLALSPDGKYALSGTNDYTMRLWDVETGKTTQSFEGHSNWISSAAFSPDGRHALSGSDRILRLWDIESGSEFGKTNPVV